MRGGRGEGSVSHANSGPALLVKRPRQHWSKSVFAHDLRRGSTSSAIEYLASMKADYNNTTLHGPDGAHEVGASHYLS